jgi:hypothetical protein
MRAVIFCRPIGPVIFIFVIQGRRASRLPLATFWPRLRRYSYRSLTAPAALQLPFGGACGATVTVSVALL